MSGPTWSPSDNPYDVPKVAKPAQTEVIGGGGPWNMDYFGGHNLIQKNPKWIGNIFMAGLCFLIPVLGPIVLVGYCFETMELLHRSNGQLYWDFNFNRFSEYLTRGLGPLLIGLVFAVVFSAVSMMFYVGTILCFALIAGQQQGPPSDGMGMLIGLILLLAFLMFLAMLVAMLLLYIPLQMRGGLSNEIGESFKFNFALEFAGKMWGEMIMVMFVWILFSFITSPIIILTCYIGYIPVMGYMMLLNAWFNYQLYRKYLSKGGRAIPLKPLPGMVQA